jgi:hypothetical protein
VNTQEIVSLRSALLYLRKGDDPGCRVRLGVILTVVAVSWLAIAATMAAAAVALVFRVT